LSEDSASLSKTLWSNRRDRQFYEASMNMGLFYRPRRPLYAIALCLLTMRTVPPALPATDVPPFVPPCRALVAAAKANHFPAPGFDEPTDKSVLTPGDSATILATQFEKGGRREQWLILIQVVSPTERERSSKPEPPKVLYTSLGHQHEFSSSHTFVSVRTIGPFLTAGSDVNPPRVEDESARITLDSGFLSLGFDRAAAAGYRVAQMGNEPKAKGSFAWGDKPFSKAQIIEGEKFAALYRITQEEEHAVAGLGLALEGFVGLAMQTPPLNKILFKTFNAPSAWSILSKGHLPRFGILTGLDAARPEDPKKWHLTADALLYELPWTVTVNNEPGLYLDAMVTTPRMPFLITGGALYLRAVNPTDPERCLTLYLLGARRGVSPANETMNAAARAVTHAPAADPISKRTSPCDKIILIGASVTHGFTGSEPFGGIETRRHNLSRYLDAALQLPHSPIMNLGNSLFFMQPDSLGEQQVQTALDANPTMVIGIDFLFWFCYGKTSDEEARLRHFERGLELLEAVHSPLIVGDIPDVSAASEGILSSDEIPTIKTLAAANRRLKQWAGKHPAVVVIPLAKFIKSAMADQALTVHGFTLPAGKTRALIQEDKLHPTPRGCAALALAILDALQASQPDIAEGDVCWNADTVSSNTLEKLQKEASDAP
jgi:hypothetical protein